MHIHILGICGTFMGSLALLARELGHTVSGVDQQIYPPMSDQLRAADIELLEGYENHGMENIAADRIIVGNAMSRGNPAVEYVLNHRLPYVSGPAWLAEQVLGNRHVLAVAGTHGKTTTASMLAWILDYAGLKPGFLIGGVPQNFGVSARAGTAVNGEHYFVIEADEYDTAFFDKRSKFVHYRPQTLVLNNLEFDHADIFEDLASIQRQFHHVVRIVPGRGTVLLPDEPALREVIDRGCWSSLQWLSGQASPWSVEDCASDQSSFTLRYSAENDSAENEGQVIDETVRIEWSLCGEHNVQNALAAVAAARQVGVAPAIAGLALQRYNNVKRRLELVAQVGSVRLFDDFAHHPTAIASTLKGVRKKYPEGRVVAVIEPRSNTMKMGVHNASLGEAVKDADRVFWYEACSDADTEIDGQSTAAALAQLKRSHITVHNSVPSIIDELMSELTENDLIVIMSNGGFEGIHSALANRLQDNHR